MQLRQAQHTDIPFLREMLYEAVFWRDNPDKPSFEEGLAYPEVSKILADWGERDGDTAVVATINSIHAGAAWFRFWSDDDPIRGYLDENTPVLVIGVHKDHRHQGIGTRLLGWLIDYAAQHAIPKISLMVSKDNYAINLYRQQGFREYADTEDSILMVRNISACA